MSEFVTHREHAKELKEYKQVIDNERHEWIKERIQPSFTTFWDWISNNKENISILKIKNENMAENVSEIKADVSSLKEDMWKRFDKHENTLTMFLEKIEGTYVTKKEYSIIVKIIWGVAIALIGWGAAFIWDRISSLI